MPQRLLRSVLWQRADTPALEHCRLFEEEAGVRLSGTVLTLADGMAAELRYDVHCAPDWTTRSASLEAVIGGRVSALALRMDERSGWTRDGAALAGLEGASDVDLGFSPCTNTLPIRRLALRPGESADIVAAWVRFPDLAVLPLDQRYARLGERNWRYESRDGSFSADLEVDDLGLVIRYADIWRRLGG